MSKYLFLDIDGVMNNGPFLQSKGEEINLLHDWDEHMVDPKSAKLLADIVSTVPDLKVVLSSTWRLTPGAGVALRALRKAGMPENFRFDGITPRLVDQGRGKEIEAYIKSRGIAPSDICILDDDCDMDPLKSRWVRTLFNEGLTPEKAAQVINMLGGRL